MMFTVGPARLLRWLIGETGAVFVINAPQKIGPPCMSFCVVPRQSELTVGLIQRFAYRVDLLPEP